MRTTTVSIYRPDGVLFAQHILVQVDQQSKVSQVEHLAVGDHHVGDIWMITTLGWYPNALIRRADLLIDERYVDPNNANGSNYRYRVESNVMNFDLDHQEMVADSGVGT